MLDFRGKWITITRSAAAEMVELGLDAEDVARFLEEGKEPRRRGRGKSEKWFPRGESIYNVVVCETENDIFVIHVGKFTKTKAHMARLRQAPEAGGL